MTQHITRTPCYDKKPTYIITSEGYLKAKDARLARIGIQEYRAFELGLTNRPAMDVIKVYRPPEEVFTPEAMDSFDGKPVTNDHPLDFVTVDNWRSLAIGTIQNPRKKDTFLVADLVVTDKGAIGDIVSGKTELSNGYSCVYDWTKGLTPSGESYDAIQREIRGNHVALVDSARCGPACSITDSEVKKMPDRKIIIDSIPFDLPEGAAAAVEKVVGERDAAIAAKKTIESKQADGVTVAGKTYTSAAVEALILAKDNEIAALKKDVMTPEQRDAMVQEWATTLDTGKRLMPALVTTGKTCDAIRREVVTSHYTENKATLDAVLGGQTVATADSGTLKVAFGVLAASVKVQPTTDALTTFQAPATTVPHGTVPVVDSRTAYLNRVQGRA